MDEATIRYFLGLKVNGERICSIKFANDQAIVEGSVKSLQNLHSQINDTAKVLGLKINASK